MLWFDGILKIFLLYFHITDLINTIKNSWSINIWLKQILIKSNFDRFVCIQFKYFLNQSKRDAIGEAQG